MEAAIEATAPPHGRARERTLGAILRPAAVTVLLWLLVALAMLAQRLYQLHAWPRQTPPGRSWVDVAIAELVEWGAWALLTPLIVAACRRAPIERARLVRSLAVHLPVAVAVSALQSLLVAAVLPLFYWAPSAAALHDMLTWRLSTALVANVLTYAMIAAVVHALRYARASRAGELRTARLEARAARAELDALAAQLQPHFLFNSLNSIIELVHADPARAESMLRALSELLRRALAAVRAGDVALRDELELVEQYLGLQRMRYEDRLRAEVRAAPDALDARVPGLLLQPLVENAIRHGVGARDTGGRVELRAERHDDRLRLVVRDDGPGLTVPNGNAGLGTGLANTRARLEHAYSGRARFDLAEAPGGGLEVRIEIPFIDHRTSTTDHR